MEQKNNFRTDFANERIEKEIKNDEIEMTNKTYRSVETQIINVLKDENVLESEKGTYISVTFDHLQDQDIRDDVVHVLTQQLHYIMHKHVESVDRCLIVGLGNSQVVADALGPKVCRKVLVTRHLFEHDALENPGGICNVSCITPGVMGQTGLESSDIIAGISQLVQPSLLIVIDALATKSMNRINRMIQISDTGIAPGSGVGNNRKAIHMDTLKVPVIVIGVATVVDVKSIARDVIHLCMEKERQQADEAYMEDIFKKLHDRESMPMIVTPKQMDEDLIHLVEVISNSINQALHRDFHAL